MYFWKIRPINALKLASEASTVSSVKSNVEEGSILKEGPGVNSFLFPNISFTFPKEEEGNSLRTMPGGLRANGGVHMGTQDVNN